MNWESLRRELADASAYDLVQIQTTIDRMLEDPARIEAVRRRLRPKLEIRYWDSSKGQEVEAVVVELRRTQALVENLGDGERWLIRFTSIAVDEHLLPVNSGEVPKRHQWKIGDTVLFPDRQNRDLVGTILRLNPKRAVVDTAEGIWHVHYHCLSHVVDAEGAAAPAKPRLTLEAE